MQKNTTIPIQALKVTIMVQPVSLPIDCVTPDGQPMPDPVFDLVLPDQAMTLRAKVNGKNYRKMIKQIAEVGNANVTVILQGKLIPPPRPGDPFTLDGAGFTCTVKQPAPEKVNTADVGG